MAKITVYHGGYNPVDFPKIREGRYTKVSLHVEVEKCMTMIL